jgi:hypothetical protein
LNGVRSASAVGHRLSHGAGSIVVPNTEIAGWRKGPVYVTNVAGVITYYNRGRLAFAGRTPRVGPMAVALQDGAR